MSFMNRKKRIRFIEAKLSESTEQIKNPSRGWYRLYPFPLEQAPDFEELFWCLCEEESLALVMIDIGAFRAQAISEEALGHFSDILQFFSDHHKEMILRIVYDREGRGMEREPEFMQTVEGHMRQLGPLIRAYAENVFLIQGLFIGSWGEMHDSRFLSGDRLKKLAQVWREAVGNEICIAVRTPQQWRLLHGENEYRSDTAAQASCLRLGVFDDGMFGSSDNLGTYGVLRREDAGWEERWCREDELAWIGGLSCTVPYGGEAVGHSEAGALPTAVAEMRQTGLAYLNRTHDAGRLQEWENAVWTEAGVWNGCKGLTYIGCHMGYRLVVRGAEKKRCDGKTCLLVRIENVGFAALREEAILSLLCGTESGAQGCAESLCGLHGLNSGELLQAVFALPESLTGGVYTVSIQAKRKKDGQLLFFANEPVADRVQLGMIQIS